LETWARETGCWRERLSDFGTFVEGGAGHRIQRGDDVYLKATHPGRCGFTVIATPGGPTLTHALPGEYLRRLLASNRIFNDDVRLLGFTKEDGQMVVITAQPTIVGDGVEPVDMLAFFESLYFIHVPGFTAGYKGAMTFYRDLDQMAVFDAHAGNFLQDRSGLILPIDGVVVECDEQLAAQVAALLPDVSSANSET
jgi:hypothetical protein